MEIISNIFWGVLFIGAGVVVIKYGQELSGLFGHFGKVEHYVGANGTYLLWLMIGFFSVLVGILALFGLVDNVLRFIFAPIINTMSQ